jgi:signal peptidase
VHKNAAVRRLLLLCKGDANAGFDPAVELGQCVGKLLWIRRSGGASAVIVRADRGVAVWWGKLVLAFPLISRLLRRWLDRGGRGGTRLHD